MKINKLYIGFLLIVVLFISDEVSSDDTALNVANAALPALTAVIVTALGTSPAGPFVAVGLGLIHVASMIFLTDHDDPDPISKADLKTLNQGFKLRFKDLSDRIAASTSNIISELTYTIESQPILSEMRTTLDELRADYDYHLDFILDHQQSAITRSSMNEMINFDSTFRQKLRSFISKFIKTSVSISSTPVKLFFDLLHEKNRLLAADNSDCYNDSLHSRMYKAYVVIIKILTDSYAMASSAYTIQYQTEISQGNTINANDVKKAAKKLIEEYQNSMQLLMAKAKNSLDLASREIRNCCKFILKEGENFARLPFLTTITHAPNGHCSVGYGTPIKMDGYQVLKCSSAEELSVPIDENTFYETYYNPNDKERPLVHMKYGDSMFGHSVPQSTHLVKGAYNPGSCFPEFCTVYKNRVVGVSNAVVKAKQGNVITGVRWRVRKNILYIDIQEGTLLNAIEVDPETVHWTEAPESRTVTYFNKNMRAIEIADVKLEDGDYVASVALYLSYPVSHPDGIIWMEVAGTRYNPNNVHQSRSLSNNEIKLTEADDPEKASLTRFITMPPDAKKAAYIQLQVSSIKKDFGRTTIPYFDTRDVVTYPPSPIAGLGIYHEAGEEDGGLLALKLISPNLSSYIDYNQVLAITTPLLQHDQH